jgi:hypothetical protein
VLNTVEEVSPFDELKWESKDDPVKPEELNPEQIMSILQKQALV